MMTTRTYFIIFVFAVSVSGLISSCSSADKPSIDDASEVKVTTAEAQQIALPRNQTYSGTIKGKRRINLSTKVMGRIVQLEVNEGDFAEQGDLLLQIKDDKLKAQLHQVKSRLSEARSNLENTKTNYQRIKRLYQQSSATQKEYDDMKTRYQMAQSKVETLKGKLREIKDMLDYTALTSPIDGYIVRKMVEEGDMASPGRTLLTIENTNALEVQTTVPESQINLLKVGDTVQVKVPAADKPNLKGRITAINPSGNRKSRQFGVKVVFREPGPDKRVKPGMFAEWSIQQQSDPTITVDRAALINRGQLTGLYTLNEQREAVLRWVRVGQQAGEKVEILSGISRGESYILSPGGRIHEGQKVEIQ